MGVVVRGTASASHRCLSSCRHLRLRHRLRLRWYLRPGRRTLCYNIYLPCAFCAHVQQLLAVVRLATCNSMARLETWPRPFAERSLPATWHILNTFHALLNSVVVAQVPQGYLLLENMFTRVVHILIVCFADIFRHCKMYLCACTCVCACMCFVACLTCV